MPTITAYKDERTCKLPLHCISELFARGPEAAVSLNQNFCRGRDRRELIIDEISNYGGAFDQVQCDGVYRYGLERLTRATQCGLWAKSCTLESLVESYKWPELKYRDLLHTNMKVLSASHFQRFQLSTSNFEGVKRDRGAGCRRSGSKSFIAGSAFEIVP
ncbi:hypothetical protein B0H19DRAFT_1085182 [Mycena capillaripes]|nr:hypothetical protein B0H19DRAFT_1085182 [Mycena capillaripes]